MELSRNFGVVAETDAESVGDFEIKHGEDLHNEESEQPLRMAIPFAAGMGWPRRATPTTNTSPLHAGEPVLWSSRPSFRRSLVGSV
jgi:hypothetical protein